MVVLTEQTRSACGRGQTPSHDDDHICYFLKASWFWGDPTKGAGVTPGSVLWDHTQKCSGHPEPGAPNCKAHKDRSSLPATADTRSGIVSCMSSSSPFKDMRKLKLMPLGGAGSAVSRENPISFRNLELSCSRAMCQF